MRSVAYIVISLMPIAVWAQGLSLGECIEKAYDNYPAVRQYGLIERTRDYNLSNAAKGWLPQIGLSAGAFAFTDIIDSDVQDNMGVSVKNHLLNASVSISQSIYDGGQTAAARGVTRAQAEVERRQLDVTMYDIDERVQQIFFGLLLIDEQIRQNLLLQEDLEISYKSVESMLDGGVANQSDLDAVKVEQIRVQQQEGALRSSRKAYLRMLGVMIGENIPEETSLSLPDTGQPADGDGTARPEISFFKAQENLLDKQRKQLNARLRPTISALAVGLTHNSVTDIMNNSLLIGGISLSWNFGALYTRKNDIRKLETQRLTIDSQRETFLFNTKLDYEDSNGAIETLKSQIRQDEEIVSLRESIRSKSERKVQAGTESVNEMLRDINAVSQSRQQKALHEIQLLKELYNLKHIIGL